MSLPEWTIFAGMLSPKRVAGCWQCNNTAQTGTDDEQIPGKQSMTAARLMSDLRDVGSALSPG